MMAEASLSELIELLKQGDEAQAEAAAVQMAAHGEAGLQALRELLQSQAEDIRWWTVRALSEFPQGEAGALVHQALADSAESVRYCALLALRKQPHPGAIPDLIQLLESKDRMQAHLASDALTAAGGLAIPALLDALKNSPQAARLEAIRAIALIGDMRAVPALFAALDEESALLEYWANQGLERLGIGMTFFNP